MDLIRPVAVDLFAGAGGMSLGFEQAGFDIAAAVELDPIHAATHLFNFPTCGVVPRSVVGLDGAEIRGAGIGDRRVDVVFGGAPCQGFSLIGHRALDDPRNALVREFVRLVAELDASFFVFENVKGLTLGQHRNFLAEFVEVFAQSGYTVRTPWQILNASDFGVPQDRERLFLVGAKNGLTVPEYPRATCAPAGWPIADADLPVGPSCHDALEDLPDADQFEELLEFDWTFASGWRPKSDYARKMHCTVREAWGFGYERRWDRNLLTSSMRTLHTDISRRRFERTLPGNTEPISRFFRLPASGLSNTLRAGTDSARGAFTSPRPIHYKYPRCVTVREMARLHGFPDWFRFHVTKWHGARQVGNSVPPPLACAVAEQVLRAIGSKPTHPSSALALGDLKLLQMDMSEASSLFGIQVPIGRRTMKSGARKRKQWEIQENLRSKRTRAHG